VSELDKVTSIVEDSVLEISVVSEALITTRPEMLTLLDSEELMIVLSVAGCWAAGIPLSVVEISVVSDEETVPLIDAVSEDDTSVASEALLATVAKPVVSVDEILVVSLAEKLAVSPEYPSVEVIDVVSVADIVPEIDAASLDETLVVSEEVNATVANDTDSVLEISVESVAERPTVVLVDSDEEISVVSVADLDTLPVTIISLVSELDRMVVSRPGALRTG
jgi:hypothetical protein